MYNLRYIVLRMKYKINFNICNLIYVNYNIRNITIIFYSLMHIYKFYKRTKL